MFRNSFFKPDGKLSLIIFWQERPDSDLTLRLAPFNSKALTGLVEFNYSTLLIAKCKGTNPALSLSSIFAFNANK
jgi:hypothetical protein